jgi:hypothetical protein
MGARMFRRRVSPSGPYHKLLPLEKNGLEESMTLSERTTPHQFQSSQNYRESKDCGILTSRGVQKPSPRCYISHPHHDFSHAPNSDIYSSMSRFGEGVCSIKIKTESSHASGFRSNEKKLKTSKCAVSANLPISKDACAGSNTQSYYIPPKDCYRWRMLCSSQQST